MSEVLDFPVKPEGADVRRILITHAMRHESVVRNGHKIFRGCAAGSAKGEGASRIFCLPADFGWNDLGSWTSLHEHHVRRSSPADGNLITADGSFTLNAKNNYVHAPGKFVATIGVNNLVIVETDDALLITTLEQSQDVGKIVKHLDEKKLKKLV